MSSRLRFVVALLGVAFGALGGCSTDADQRAALAVLGGVCLINSDCGESLICAFKRCHDACDTSRDCEHGERCVEGPKSRNVCQLPEEQSCSKFGGCAGGQVCGVDAECRDQCTTERDCIAEQVCSLGTCADKTELNAAGVLESSSSRPPAPAPCSYDSDCPEKELCRGGTCRPGCSKDQDCEAGQACQAGSCVSPPAPTGCVHDSECDEGDHCASGICQTPAKPPEPECSSNQDCTRAGQHCQANRCRCECETDNECARGQTCEDSCQCVASGVIQGDVEINDVAQLAALDNVVQITGLLSIRIWGTTTELHVQSLRSVGNVVVRPGRPGYPDVRVTFDALETATSGITCDAALCQFPKLRTADSLTLRGDTSLSLPALESAGIMKLRGSLLVEFSAPLLEHAQSIQLTSGPALTKIDLSALAHVTVGLGLNGASPNLELSLPKLESALGVSISNGFAAVSLPHLKTASFTLMNSSVTKLSLPELTSAQSFLLEQNKELVSVSVPLLGSTDDLVVSFQIKDALKLIQLDARSLDSVQSLVALTFTGLTDLYGLDPDTTPLHGSLKDAGEIKIDDNPALSRCLVAAFSQRLKDIHGWLYGPIANERNLDAPVGGCP